MKTFIKRLIAVLTAVAAVIAIVTVILLAAGYHPFVLESPSMEPLYRTGSLCWINTRIPLSSIQKGDVIAYRSEIDSLVLHRVVDVLSSDRSEITVSMKGDANDLAQEITLGKINYLGREAFTIPGLGSAVSALSSLTWIVYAVMIVIVIIACIPWKSRDKKTVGGETT